MSPDPFVSSTVLVDGAERRYESVRLESDLFAVTLYLEGEPAGPTDYVRSHHDVEQLGNLWLYPHRLGVDGSTD